MEEFFFKKEGENVLEKEKKIDGKGQGRLS